MQVLAIEREVEGVVAGAFTAELAAAEARRAWELHQDGLVRERYFRADMPSAVLVLESPSVEAAAALLGTLPLVRAGLVRFEIVPLRAYPGFGRLFAGAG